jgi:hypothetical protein
MITEKKFRKGQTINVKPTGGALRPARIVTVTSQSALVVYLGKGNTASVTVAANTNKTGTPRLASQ